MTLAVYLGSAEEITARLSAPPSNTTTTVDSVTSSTIFDVASASSFSVSDPIVVRNQKRIIADITGSTITTNEAFDVLPQIGDVVRHYNADYSYYRDTDTAMSFVDDLDTGGNTGDAIGKDLTVINKDGNMATPIVGARVSIFETENPAIPLFAGVIVSIREQLLAKTRGGIHVKSYLLGAKGYQWEADGIGIEEEPVVNVNAGKFLQYLMAKYTTLDAGMIDIVNSPTIDYIRLQNYKRFSDVGKELAGLWPGAEFFIQNDHTVGKVYFRQRSISYAPIVLNDSYLESVGPQGIEITKDHSRTFNIVRLPFYKLQTREPDIFVQSNVSDNAYLKTSVALNGQPANIEDSILLFDDFADAALSVDWTEDDVTNPNPPSGYTNADGYLVEGAINDVVGLHLLDTSSASPAIILGDIGRVTDPGVTEPFSGEERQLLFIKEIVVSALGEAVIGGIIDNTTISTTVASGATTTSIPVADASDFSIGDRITVGGLKTYITNISTNTLTVSPALSGSPSAGDMVLKHRLAKSRIKFGVYFKGNGDLKYIKNGVETAFSTPQTYTASPTTYAIRIFMQSFETTITSGISSTGCTLSDASNFATGDVVEIFTSGSRKDPETRVITKAGSNITYAATNATPSVGYRIRTKPKIVVQMKGGAFGSITGRDWTTIHTDANTWQTTTSTPDDHGVILCINKSLVGTISLLKMSNPPGITANIGSRYLHIGTQEVDSAEPDIDCIVRKVGNHYQLDFFPDTKALWASEETLELRYNEKFRHDLEETDAESMKAIAKQRGYTLTGNENLSELMRLGGKTMDTVELLPNTLNTNEASNQSRALLEAVKDLFITGEIRTNSYSDTLVKAGQIIQSEIPGIEDLEIKRVQITEIPGAKNSSDEAVYYQTIYVGSIDRISDFLLKRKIRNNNRLVLDDGVNDDSFTKINKNSFLDKATSADSFEMDECLSPTTIIFDGSSYAKIKCVRIPAATSGSSGQPLGLLLLITKAS